jgi:putative lipase involved disintegration of autophagic bodies
MKFCITKFNKSSKFEIESLSKKYTESMINDLKRQDNINENILYSCSNERVNFKLYDLLNI